jgi:hypothetical protein
LNGPTLRSVSLAIVGCFEKWNVLLCHDGRQDQLMETL